MKSDELTEKQRAAIAKRLRRDPDEICRYPSRAPTERDKQRVRDWIALQLRIHPDRTAWELCGARRMSDDLHLAPSTIWGCLEPMIEAGEIAWPWGPRRHEFDP